MHRLILILLTTCLLAQFSPLNAQLAELDWPIETVSEGHGFTEGASLALDGTIFFSDMDKQKIMQYDPVSGTTKVWQKESGKSNGLCIRDHYLYACEALGRSMVRYDLRSGPGSREVLTSTFQGDSLGCPNDVTVIGNTAYFTDFWIGKFHKNTGATRQILQDRVYSFDQATGFLDTLKFDFFKPNGVAASPDGKYLFVGDEARKLYKARINKGKIGPLKLLADMELLGVAAPDGMTISRDGRIFLALYQGDLLLVLNPDGSPVGTLSTGPLTSNCIFAADGKTLYMTSDKKLKRIIVPRL